MFRSRRARRSTAGAGLAGLGAAALLLIAGAGEIQKPAAQSESRPVAQSQLPSRSAPAPRAWLQSEPAPQVRLQPQPKAFCAAEVSYPLEVQVQPRSTVGGGGVVSATVDVSARIPLDRVEIELEPSPQLDLLAPRRMTFDALRIGERHTTDFAVRWPGAERAVVQVHVRTWSDGFLLTRTAVLDLRLDDGEVGRTLTRADGQRIYQVAGRRVDG